MIPCASKSGPIKFSEQCLHIITHKSRFNVLEGCSKTKRHEYQSKYDSHFYNMRLNNIVKHREIKLIWNNNIFHNCMSVMVNHLTM